MATPPRPMVRAVQGLQHSHAFRLRSVGQDTTLFEERLKGVQALVAMGASPVDPGVGQNVQTPRGLTVLRGRLLSVSGSRRPVHVALLGVCLSSLAHHPVSMFTVNATSVLHNCRRQGHWPLQVAMMIFSSRPCHPVLCTQPSVPSLRSRGLWSGLCSPAPVACCAFSQ